MRDHNLTVHATVAEATALIQAIEDVGMNYEWHMRQPFATNNAQSVHLDLRMTLANARALIASEAAGLGLQGPWSLLPNKV